LRTQVGETRSVLLADGSRVVLGGDTQLKISLDTLQRHLNLTRGEALFNVVKDAARPFTVYAGNTTVTAIGTEFNVRRSRDRIVVAVVEGRVTVAPEHEQKPVQLDAGQQTIVDRKGVKSTVKLLDAAAATAWQSGRLVFRGEPLRYVLEDVNRYSLKPIVLQDERIGDIRITGTVLGGSVEGWIASLENAFALKAVEGRDEIVLSKAR
jgi:transmembrane sensor